MRNFILPFLLFLMLSSCSSTEKEKILNYGKIENNVYRNDYFAIEVKIPEGWVVQNRDQIEQLTQQGEERIKSVNKELAKQIDLSQEQTVYLLTVFKNAVEEASPENSFNNSFMLMAEKLPNDSFQNGKQYLVKAAQMLNQSGQYQRIDEGITAMQVDGRTFYKLKAFMDTPQLTIEQSIIATVWNNYALAFILTYADKEQMKELDDVISSVSFNKD
jgi:hypothetical protein